MFSSLPTFIAKNGATRVFSLLLMLLLVFAFSACTATTQTLPDATEDPASEEATTEEAASDEMTSDMESAVESIDPLTLDQALAPVALSIPSIQMETAIEPMGWTVVEADGERTTKWIVPESAAGWHVNSAGAGAAGNLILSGHQVQGDAVFAPLSLGDVAAGQEILVEDEENVVFVYQIVDVSKPIPASGASEAEMAQAMDYLAQTDDALLTLITGWPDFTTTHRMFARAELLGVQK